MSPSATRLPLFVTALACVGALFIGCEDPENPDANALRPPEQLHLPAEVAPTGDEFIVAILPDTQIYSQSFPETFERQTRWLAAHADEYNIQFVSHVGDIVQHGGSDEQWANAVAAIDWLRDAGIPHGFSVAGHDFSHGPEGFDHDFDNSCSDFADVDCDAVDYLERFGPDQYAEDEWYAGASPSGQSSYQLVTIDEMELLFLHLPQDVPRAEADWAHEVLDAHPGALAHLTTHRYLFDYRLTAELDASLAVLPAGRFNTLTYTLGGQSLKYHTSLEAQSVFTEVVAAHPNIWAVHCGHVDAQFHQVSENAAGLPVYENLVDYQNYSDGGGGWLRLLKFMPSENQVQAYTFSTTTGALRTRGEGFDHAIGILDNYKNQAAPYLGLLGTSIEEVDALLAEVRTMGSEMRGVYYDSLYEDGSRDPEYVMDVDFEAYMEASE